MIIYNRNFYDENGNTISEEKYKQKLKQFEKEIEKEYNQMCNTIINEIPKELSDSKKLELIYYYLINSVRYDYQVLNYINSNGQGKKLYYKYRNWGNWGISSAEKYGPILLKLGICSGIAIAFKNLCNRVGINCETIRGKTRVVDDINQVRLSHIWNIITINNEIRHIDVTYGIKNKDKGQNPMAYFNLTTEELKGIGPHNSFEGNLNKHTI